MPQGNSCFAARNIVSAASAVPANSGPGGRNRLDFRNVHAIFTPTKPHFRNSQKDCRPHEKNHSCHSPPHARSHAFRRRTGQAAAEGEIPSRPPDRTVQHGRPRRRHAGGQGAASARPHAEQSRRVGAGGRPGSLRQIHGRRRPGPDVCKPARRQRPLHHCRACPGSLRRLPDFLLGAREKVGADEQSSV